jgi:hypothetical protein
VRADNKLGEHLVLNGIDGIADDAEDVETRQNRLGELDVLLEGDGRVVPAADGVGCGDNGTTSLERSNDTSL